MEDKDSEIIFCVMLACGALGFVFWVEVGFFVGIAGIAGIA